MNFEKIACFPFAVALLMSGFLMTGCLEKKDTSPTLARFDESSITESDFTSKIKRLPKDMQNVVLRHRRDFIQDLVDEHFLEKEAKRRKIQALPDVQQLIQEARQKIVIAKLIETEVDRKISLAAGEAEKYYEDRKDQFMTPLLLRASHILVPTKEEAEAIRAQLVAGADFAEVARAKSIDSTAARGGDLGFFQRGQLIPQFEEVAFKLNKGDISEVFRTQFGFHIIQLTDRAEPKIREFKAVKSLVEKQLINEKRVKRYREFVAQLKSGAKIAIDEKRLDSLYSNPASETK